MTPEDPPNPLSNVVAGRGPGTVRSRDSHRAAAVQRQTGNCGDDDDIKNNADGNFIAPRGV